MTLEMAERLLTRVREGAARAGMNLAAWVVDAGGYPVAMFRMDGCRLLAADVALGKAFTAAVFRMDSARVAAVAHDDPVMWQSVVAVSGNRLVLGAGGVPLLEGGKIVGALGISGGTAEQDAEAAGAAAEAAGLTN